jgi:hypothetical protein
MAKKQYIRHKIKRLYVATSATTNTRDTKLNVQFQNYYNLPESYLALLWPTCRADAIL